MAEEIKAGNDVPAAEIKAEGAKLEWGQDLGQMSWNQAQEKSKELNSKLSKEEKKWRLPNLDELAAKLNETGSTPDGFQPHSYWTSEEDDDIPEYDIYPIRRGACARTIVMKERLDMFGGGTAEDKDSHCGVRLVRDTA